MSTSLIVVLPAVLLGIVGLLCFVGCALSTGGLGGGTDTPPPFTAYTATTILPNPTIMAYWPLKEAKDTDPAVELISGNNGKYIDPNTVEVSTIYPWPSYSIPNGANPDVLSDAAPGKIALAQPTIVKGDVDLLPGDPVPPACMVVNGAYVEALFNVKFIPPTSFTVEAWVRADWSAADPNAFRFVVDMREFNPATAGFALCAKPVDGSAGLYQWRGIIGDGSSAFSFADSSELTVPLGSVQHLALTYDSGSQTLTLFVNGAQQAKVTNVAYAPNATQPLWIGAGAPYVPRRPQAAGVVGSPLFPFVGAIQDVAIYSAALDSTTILQHFNDGSGKPHPSP
jgi:hypothetical protein